MLLNITDDDVEVVFEMTGHSNQVVFVYIGDHFILGDWYRLLKSFYAM